MSVAGFDPENSGGIDRESISRIFEPAFGSKIFHIEITLDVFGSAHVVSDLSDLKAVFEPLRDAGNDLVAVTSDEELLPGPALSGQVMITSASAPWRMFRCRFASGIEDHIAICSHGEPQGFSAFLEAAWTGLRRFFMHQAVVRAKDISEDALLWMVHQKVNAAMLVMDARLSILQCNDAGAGMIREGRLLALKNGVLTCGNKRETQALRAAVRECEREGARTEFIIILRGVQRDAHVPMSLSVYPDPNRGEKLFLAMLPLPPEQKRIERIAVELGLTPVEARVAALIRSGHSNRKAAEIAGLKVETFNTYAKRVMSKMNVSCRSEMAQMLTWQSAMERSI